jgi:hypothetical protein
LKELEEQLLWLIVSEYVHELSTIGWHVDLYWPASFMPGPYAHYNGQMLLRIKDRDFVMPTVTPEMLDKLGYLEWQQAAEAVSYIKTIGMPVQMAPMTYTH